jgi:hypothetical protein
MAYAPKQGQAVPEPGKGCGEGCSHESGGQLPEEEIRDEEDGRGHARGDEGRRRDGGAVGQDEQGLLVLLAPTEAMRGRRRDEEDDRCRGAEQRSEVDVDLALRELLEALLEREHEEEGEENLRARHGEPVLLDELAPLLIEVLRRLLFDSLPVVHHEGGA